MHVVKSPIRSNLTACSTQLCTNNHRVLKTLWTLHRAQHVPRGTSYGTFLNRNLCSCMVSTHVQFCSWWASVE